MLYIIIIVVILAAVAYKFRGRLGF